MIKEQIPMPNYPELSFPGLSYESLNKRIPDYISATKWYARVWISSIFVIVAAITSISCYYFELTNDLFYVSSLGILLFLYIITMPMLTRIFVTSVYITNKISISKRKYFYRLLANTPTEHRLVIANNIWNALKSDEWRLYINLANNIDRVRAVHCCHELGQIASDLTSTNPRRFCRAMFKTINNQRGGVRYFFDTIVMLGERELNNKNEHKSTIRNTQKLLMDDLFIHR